MALFSKVETQLRLAFVYSINITTLCLKKNVNDVAHYNFNAH